MCGRLSQYHLERMRKLTELAGELKLSPRYNVPPSTDIAAIRQRDDGGNEWTQLHWGLIPSWARDKKFGYRTINAMAETVAQKPAFRSAFRRHRCIIPADGFYEWRVEDGRKQPYYVHMADPDEPLLLAGLWEHWEQEGQVIESCTIITTGANTAVRAIHDRMPVLLSWQTVRPWLDVNNHDVAQLQTVLQPYTGELVLTRVSPRVNNPRNDGPECIAAVA